MQLTQQQQQMQELQNTLVSKCWEEESFKQTLISDPMAAIKKLTGKTLKLAEGKTLVVVDQTTESNVYLNIPAIPNLDDIELSDEALEQVAGGITPGWLIIAGYFAVGATIGASVADWLGED